MCASPQLDPCPPDDPATAARYNYYREPLREVLRGARPAHLTAEEHTAQLSQRDVGTVYATTEEFELRFQDIALSDEQPPVDVLSCTTTMEVGIDIGSLVAIGLRNVPPQRENYQQRAGRAGRRGSAISTVVTYADSGPHDHFYYQHPEAIIAGDPRRPLLKIDRPALARRHVYAYLLQTFFHKQMEQLAPSAREELRRQRGALFTALGSKVEFFEQDGMLSFATFRRWLEAEMQLPGGAMVGILGWLPNQALPDEVSAATFVREVALGLIDELESLGRAPTEGEATEQPHQGELLDSLFDAGLLPTYAFPTDLASFYIFKRDGDRVTIKERPQQSKSQALSEYAPGRLLVVNKETYRVGGIHSGNMKAPAKYLFHKPLPVYVFCPECTYVRLDPRRGSERCPICDTELHVSELLDPPGFSPEKGRPVDERDRDQDISYALGAQLPLPVSPDQLDWRQGSWPHLQYAYAENRTFVITNRGLDDDGFVVCESCGAAWPAASAPRDGAHDRPYLIPPQFGSPRCRGPLHDAPIYLGTTFRSDLLLIRAALQPALQYEPGSPWLRDALRTTVEALSLAASRVLDVDPAELSAGYRHLPQDASGTAIFDLYLFDTASGGAGYAAEAGAEIGAILEAALDVVEGCPRQCQRSCTRCLRHYGNRFWHSSLDRRLAAQLLRHLMYGEVPAVASPAEQRNQLTPLRRFLELEGWDIDEEGSPLAVRRGGQTIVIGTYPALLNPNAPELRRRTGRRGDVQLRDYVVERDLPAAYAELRQAVGAR